MVASCSTLPLACPAAIVRGGDDGSGADAGYAVNGNVVLLNHFEHSGVGERPSQIGDRVQERVYSSPPHPIAEA